MPSEQAQFARTPLLGALLSSTLLLASCTEGDSGTVAPAGDDGATRISMQPPAPILAVRAIDRGKLQLLVTVDGTRTPAEPQNDGTWLATVLVPRGRDVTVAVLWSEELENQLLGLASAEKVGQVGLASGTTRGRLEFASDEFDISADTFDVDNDGISNLAERNAGTDPFDSGDPGEPVTTVTASLEIRLPQILRGVEGLFIEAIVGNRLIALTQDGELYRGSATVSADSSVFTRVRVYQDASQRLLLATFSRSADSGSGNAVSVSGEDFETDDLDRDGDGRSNAREVAEGTDPLRSDLDPCEISRFASGCTLDTDGDGRADSQEGETRDSDGDLIPDHRESRLRDSDDDGLNDESDPANDDPCRPNSDNMACDALTGDPEDPEDPNNLPLDIIVDPLP